MRCRQGESGGGEASIDEFAAVLDLAHAAAEGAHQVRRVAEGGVGSTGWLQPWRRSIWLMPESVMVLWKRRPMSVLILARVQVWFGQPCASGPLSSSSFRAANSPLLSSGRESGPVERRASGPASCQAGLQR